MFAMDSGVMLGLWSRHTVEPAATAKGGGGEIAVTVADAAAVDATHADWSARGLKIDVALNAEDGLLTLGNASELREVFVNLIVNAVDAMPKGGQLTICCEQKLNRLRLGG